MNASRKAEILSVLLKKIEGKIFENLYKGKCSSLNEENAL